ncbi:cell division protein FtsX [Phocaeicola paurosaccharolyticus]|jgi:cell division transport system permease protein|uniref:cell division protein FtsX n=1 Tax=Phocaeicola paurosaccharolyticus TaxID=732242 RepID=UPI00046AED7F|nr:permease-like cell division protein FtsX [Phocaeicola paurosaccharolyticus]
MKRKSVSFFDMQFIISSISTMLVLLLLGIVLFFVLSANSLSTYVRENISFSVLLSDEMSRSQALDFQKELNKNSFVKETKYISKEDALKEQTKAMGTDPAEFLGYNPFTSSIEINLNADYANSDSLKWIEKSIKMNKKVLEIDYPDDLLELVNDNIRKISLVLLGLAGLLTLISFALINNTIRLTVYSKRFIINTMKLVGAKWSFIRKPILLKHVWIGITAAILADAILCGMVYFLIGYEPDIVEIITTLNVVIVMASVFVFGVLITSVCAYFSINKYLKMSANNLYYI